MEVSEDERQGTVDPDGQELIKAVVSLSGLPESLARLELDHILDSAGQSSQNLTLEQLRYALVAYLEAMNDDFLGSK
jgi:hypothetical protein